MFKATVVFAALAVLAAAPPASAQAPGQTDVVADPFDQQRPARVAQNNNARTKRAKARRARVRQRMRAFVMWKLADQGGLSQQQVARVMKVIDKLEPQQRAIAKEQRKVMQELRRLQGNDQATDAQFNAAMARAMKVFDRRNALARTRMKAVSQALPARQASAVMVLLPEIERQIKRKMREAMRQRRGGGGGAVKDPFRGDRQRRRQRRQRPGAVDPF